MNKQNEMSDIISKQMVDSIKDSEIKRIIKENNLEEFIDTPGFCLELIERMEQIMNQIKTDL